MANAPDTTSPTVTGAGRFIQSGHFALLPARISVPGTLTDKAISAEVVALCDRFHVKVSSGLRVSSGDHRCGAAADFVGSTQAMLNLYNYAQSNRRYAYVEPWRNSTTIGVDGTTGPHVHISFFRCNPLSSAPGAA